MEFCREKKPNFYQEKIIISKYKDCVKNAMMASNSKFQEYLKNPEQHPRYGKEWKIFWNRRYSELLAEGLDADNYDYEQEWIDFWLNKMNELHEQSKVLKMDEIRRNMNLSVEFVSKIDSDFDRFCSQLSKLIDSRSDSYGTQVSSSNEINDKTVTEVSKKFSKEVDNSTSQAKVDAEKENCSKLELNDLKTLLRNFSDLRYDEQDNLITYLSYFENQQQIEKLKKYVDIGDRDIDSESDDDDEQDSYNGRAAEFVPALQQITTEESTKLQLFQNYMQKHFMSQTINTTASFMNENQLQERQFIPSLMSINVQSDLRSFPTKIRPNNIKLTRTSRQCKYKRLRRHENLN